MTKEEKMEAIKTEAHSIITNNNISDTLFDLKARWADEKEYEDFNDYVEVMKNAVESNGYAFVNLSKRFELTVGGKQGNYKMKEKFGSIEITFAGK